MPPLVVRRFPLTPSLARRAAAAGLLAWLAGLPASADPVRAISRSVTSPGTAADASDDLHWDAAGRFAVFRSAATDLVAGQVTPPETEPIFLYDRRTGEVRLVSHLPGAPATAPEGRFRPPQISADGKWVVYSSDATDLVAGQVERNQDGFDVFLWSREAGTTRLVSHIPESPVTTGNSSSTTETQVPVNRLALSADGRFVTFTSQATTLALAVDLNLSPDVFLYDRDSGTVRLISHSVFQASMTANDSSSRPAISGDGRWVSFESSATNLVGGLTDDNDGTDVFLWDRDAPPAVSIRLLSRKAGAPTTTGNHLSERAVLSADGTGVAFVSQASDLEGASSDTNGSADIFHYDRSADIVKLVSHRSGQPTATASGSLITETSISADGRRVAFAHSGTDLSAGQSDSNNSFDVFLWSGGPVSLVSHRAGSSVAAGNAGTGFAAVSADGATVVFDSTATNMVAGQSDSNGRPDIFSWDRISGETTLVSHVPGSGLQTGNGLSRIHSLNANGRVVGFLSFADDLVHADDNVSTDVFHHGGEIFRDGFESGDLSAWSASQP